MLDVRSVGADLTPEQLDETMADVSYFLDEFGSTGAARRKLLEQRRDVRQLKNVVARRLGKTPEPVAPEEPRDLVDVDAPSDEVDRIMTDVQFFLDTFGSTRHARELLEKQRKEIVGLQRTVRFLDERDRKRRRDELPGDTFVFGKTNEGGIAREPHTADDNNDMEGGQTSDDGIDSVAAESSKVVRRKLVEAEPNATPATEKSLGESFIRPQRNTQTAYDKTASSLAVGTAQRPHQKPRCTRDNCTSQAQYRGLCYRHGGFRMCAARTCARKAVSGGFCRLHGDQEATSSHAKCARPDMQVDNQQSNDGGVQHLASKSTNDMCNVSWCMHQATPEGYCSAHGKNAHETGKLKPKAPAPKPSSSTAYRRDGHSICAFPGCKKWGAQNGGNSSYCIYHQDKNGNPIVADTAGSDASSNSSDSRSYRVCQVKGCREWPMRSGASPMFCANHQSWAGHYQPPKYTKTRRRDSHKTCKVTGCMKWARGVNVYCPDHVKEFGDSEVAAPIAPS